MVIMESVSLLSLNVGIRVPLMMKKIYIIGIYYIKSGLNLKSNQYQLFCFQEVIWQI